MNTSNHTGELSSGGSDPVLSFFNDNENIIIGASGLTFGVVLTCVCFFLFKKIQDRRNREDELV